MRAVSGGLLFFLLAGCAQEREPTAGAVRITIEHVNQVGEEFWVTGKVTVPDWDSDSFFSATTYDCGPKEHSRLPLGGTIIEICDVPRPDRPFPPRAAPSEDAYLEIEVRTESGPDSESDSDGTNLAVRDEPTDRATLSFRAVYRDREPYIVLTQV